MDSEAFKALVGKIDHIASYVMKKGKAPGVEPEVWLDSMELSELLKISTRTLQRMRKERTIPFFMVRNRCLYRLSDVEECVAKRIVSCTPDTLDEFRRNYLLTRKEDAHE